jgi:hypothetical protein
MEKSFKHGSKPPHRQLLNPAWRLAFERLDQALSKANTPSDLTEVEKTKMWVQTLWGKRPEPLKP